MGGDFVPVFAGQSIVLPSGGWRVMGNLHLREAGLTSAEDCGILGNKKDKKWPTVAED